MEVYKFWFSKYNNENNVLLFISLNHDELIGINKIVYLLKPILGDFSMTINKTSANTSRSRKSYSQYRDIYPYSDEKNLDYYKNKVKDFEDKIYLIINIEFNKNSSKEYILFLENINQLNGCIYGLQLFKMDNKNTVIMAGKGIEEIETPKISLENRFVKRK